MLWPILLPFKITLICFAAMIAAVTAVAPAMRLPRLPTFFMATAFATVAFIPCCSTVMKVIDRQRFGVFDYAEFEDVADFRVERYLPPAATEITIEKYAQGFRARYRISESELVSYLDILWEQYGDRSVVKRDELSSTFAVSREMHEMCFGNLRWPHLKNATEYHSPTAPNGAGFFVWYDSSEGIAYERASYW